ncbi:MAG: HyaD/HybD family hydrogenase maturation endopeptidase [Campylobacterales bacterium]|nr:HyaD/HybD family hydrogenase maturation endopeptidase [Campylobacterales bacterium]
MKKIVVIGIGNILFKDEGVGVYAGRYLEANYRFSPPIEIIDGGTLGFGLMDYYLSYDKVVILDTLSIEDAPGSVYRLPADELLGLGNYRKTAHEVEVVEMLEICSLQGSTAEVSVVGIVPEDITTVEMALSQPVRENFAVLTRGVIAELRTEGVEVLELPESATLDAIIASYGASAAR